MGYIPPRPPLRLNIDKRGMPRDYATYIRLLYRRHVADDSPTRQAFLHGPASDGVPEMNAYLTWYLHAPGLTSPQMA